MALINKFQNIDKQIQTIKADEKSRARYSIAVKSVENKYTELAKELRNKMFDKQKAFWTCEGMFASALCTRRAGKSEGGKLEMMATAFDIPNANILYGTLTKDKARSICWAPMMRLLSELGLKRVERGDLFSEDGDYKTDEVRMEVTLKNGSKIKLTGFDSSPKEIDKVLGEPYDLVILDEVQSFKGNVGDLVYKRLHITVAERRGRIRMTGTPGDVKLGFFYDINCTDKVQKFKWGLHKWSWKDNIGKSTHKTTEGMLIRDILQQELDEILLLNPKFIDTPEYAQEWLGEYFVDSDNLVYKFDPLINTYTHTPKITDCILGVDLGWHDETAMTVLGWSDESPDLYELDSYYESKVDLDEVAIQIQRFQSIYPIFQVVVDSQNKQGIQTIENRYNIGMVSADKMGKFEHIRLMNTDLRRGRIKFREHSEWIGEITKLKKKTTAREGENGKVMEDPKAPNHSADANLYAYLQCRQYWYKEPIVTTDERSEIQKQNDLDKVNRFTRKQNNVIDYEDGEVFTSWSDDYT
jgi:hypothetical protein